jgi:hypothetical protein
MDWDMDRGPGGRAEPELSLQAAHLLGQLRDDSDFGTLLAPLDASSVVADHDRIPVAVDHLPASPPPRPGIAVAGQRPNVRPGEQANGLQDGDQFAPLRQSIASQPRGRLDAVRGRLRLGVVQATLAGVPSKNLEARWLWSPGHFAPPYVRDAGAFSGFPDAMEFALEECFSRLTAPRPGPNAPPWSYRTVFREWHDRHSVRRFDISSPPPADLLTT